MRVAKDWRRAALQALYILDRGGDPAPESLTAALEGSATSEADRTEGVNFALRTWECCRTLDDELNPLSPDWPLHRQPVLDRSILRLAAQEMAESPEQWKVVISEAIDLAREFSTEESPRFINGVFDRLQRERQRNQDQSGEADHGIVSPGD
jgi:N utilization substance protein B